MSMSKEPVGMMSDPGSKEGITEHIDAYEGEFITQYPNAWSRYRMFLREYVAEFLGVCIIIIFGTGVDCQVVLSSVTGVAASQKGSYLSISFGWAIGTALGVWVSGGISGGHLNPALSWRPFRITIMLATYRGFPWKKVPGFILAQILGGLVGAGLVYANYIHAIDIFEGGRHVRTLDTASLFSTYAADYMTSVSCFFSEFLATGVLTIVVLAIGDKKNLPPPAGLAPLVLFLVILGLGASLGMETAYALNPARDLGPRILTAMVGYGKQVFDYRNQYWIWCPIMGPILGSQAGAIFYDAFLYTGDESPFNKPNAAARARHEHAAHSARRHLPAGPGADDQV
ncbi:major intrinsic protein superfamily membrane channel protein [Roridomyces roridus]|uniref:Major intrinsic protein superfamily membrane channel protein n=1 Tax=Roridomyces roridus TaxID=1738132 RepID=A0AAD7CAU0_9AGAR|nr:major intrinsic protein superfamily membrane channel protein [Roridomyces roridus]